MISAPSAFAEPPKEQDGGELSQFWQEHGQNYNVAVEIGASLKKVADGSIDLEAGTFLVENKKELTVRLPMTSWQLKPHSMVLIRVAPGSERVYCLLQSAAASCSGRNLPLQVGEELLVTDHMPVAGELTGEFEVGIRQLKAVDLDEKMKVACMEFSIVQAMEREPLLSQISHSKHAHDRSLRDRLLKAAAVLNFVTIRHGPYSGY